MAPCRFRPPPIAASLALCCLIQPQSCTLSQPGSQPGSQLATQPGTPQSAPACPHIPPPHASPLPAAPVSALPQILQPGHWEWDDGNYTWTPPQWLARPPPPTPHWRDGYWEANGGACVWHNGRFVPSFRTPRQ